MVQMTCKPDSIFKKIEVLIHTFHPPSHINRTFEVKANRSYKPLQAVYLFPDAIVKCRSLFSHYHFFFAERWPVNQVQSEVQPPD